jgi:polyisoprenoid-binding protein YceI
MRTWILLPALLVLAAAPLGAEPPAAVPAAPANLEGGDPIPTGAATIEFPWMAKQSITATSDAFERMVAQVDFSDDAHPALGSVTLSAQGGGTGSFAVKVADLKTGSTSRDEHLRSAGWLDAEKTPDIRLEITKLERTKPTVFKMEGNWTMHGVTKPISTWANVRFLPEMMHLGKDVVRVKAAFDVSLKAHGMTNPGIGSPAIADTWRVEVVLLGLLKKAS